MAGAMGSQVYGGGQKMRGTEIVLNTQGTGGSPEADGEGREWDACGADRLKKTLT